MSNNDIYKRDISWLEEADVVVAEVTRPSLGVGYEIATAENLNKKIICLIRPEEAKLSAMIGGSDGIEIKNYQSIEELKKVFEDCL